LTISENHNEYAISMTNSQWLGIDKVKWHFDFIRTSTTAWSNL